MSVTVVENPCQAVVESVRRCQRLPSCRQGKIQSADIVDSILRGTKQPVLLYKDLIVQRIVQDDVHEDERSALLFDDVGLGWSWHIGIE